MFWVTIGTNTNLHLTLINLYSVVVNKFYLEEEEEEARVYVRKRSLAAPEGQSFTYIYEQVGHNGS